MSLEHVSRVAVLTQLQVRHAFPQKSSVCLKMLQRYYPLNLHDNHRQNRQGAADYLEVVVSSRAVEMLATPVYSFVVNLRLYAQHCHLRRANAKAVNIKFN